MASSGVNIEQLGNRKGRYKNEVTVDNSLKHEGPVITAAGNVIITYRSHSQQRSAVPDQIPQPWNRASSSISGGNQNPPPTNPTANPDSPLSSNEAFVIAASDLQIKHSDNEEYWKWITSRDGRRYAELLKVWFLHIEAAITFNDLLPDTKFAAYLIFKIQPDSKGFNRSLKASVTVGGRLQNQDVRVKSSAGGTLNRTIGLPVERSDGWMEIELGNFRVDGNGDTEVVMKFFEHSDHNEKRGLLVAGIEVRPI